SSSRTSLLRRLSSAVARLPTCGAGGVESSNGEQHETSKAESPNTSKPASSPPPNAPAQALSGDETKRRMALVNADREIVRKIMTEPGPRWEPQSPPRAENAVNFFRSSTRAAGGNEPCRNEGDCLPHC